MDWIHLAEDRVIQWAVVKMVMNLWLPYGKFLVSRLKKDLCSEASVCQ